MSLATYVIITGIPWIDAPIQNLTEILSRNPLNHIGSEVRISLITAWGFLVMAATIDIHARHQMSYITQPERYNARQYVMMASLACSGLSFITTIVIGTRATSIFALLVVTVLTLPIIITSLTLAFLAARNFKRNLQLMQLVEREVFSALTLIAFYAPLVILQIRTSSLVLDRINLLLQCLILAFLPLLALRIIVHVFVQCRRGSNRTHRSTIASGENNIG